MAIVHGKKTPIETVQSFAINKGGKLISTTYHNMLQKLDWQCKEGHVFSATFNHIKNRGQWCPKCGQQKSIVNIRRRFKEDPSIREKISRGHLKRLNKEDLFAGKNHRDIARRLRDNITGLFRDPSKHKRILKLLGCTIEEFKAHLESKFQPGMSWENRGQFGWHIDHIVPLAKFDLSNQDELRLACHYTNLQPLWWRDNLNKGSKYVKE